MGFSINFNDPNILRGYLDQAIGQVFGEDAKKYNERITVGSEGGLAYAIFSETRNVPTRVGAGTLNDAEKVISYFDALKDYIRQAEILAESYGFSLVQTGTPGRDRQILDYSKFAYLYYIAIGSYNIDSPKKFEDFIAMAQKADDFLNEKYKNLELALSKIKGEH